MTRVAILLPAHNAMPYLHETIDAINAQTYRDYVVIAVDDGSTDGTLARLQHAAEQEPSRWKVFSNPRNLGMTGNWNGLLTRQRQLAPRVEYLWKVDADDVPDANLLRRAVAELDGDPAAALCHFQVRFIGSDARLLLSAEAGRSAVDVCLRRHGWSLDSPHRMPSADALWLMIRYDNLCVSSGTVFRKSVVETLAEPQFDDRFRWAADYEFWTRLAGAGALRYVTDACCGYRVHDTNVTSSTTHRRRRREIALVSLRAARRSARVLGLERLASLLPILALKSRYLVVSRG
jgi:glycosyltransferase involved in cell wall biosynthesis